MKQAAKWINEVSKVLASTPCTVKIRWAGLVFGCCAFPTPSVCLANSKCWQNANSKRTVQTVPSAKAPPPCLLLLMSPSAPQIDMVICLEGCSSWHLPKVVGWSPLLCNMSFNPLSTWQPVEKNDQAFHHLPELCSSTPDIAGAAYLKYTIHVKSYQRYVLGCFVISSYIYTSS